MVELELQSTYGFQGNRWLADVAPRLLTPDQRIRLPLAKERAKVRQELEATLPKHLLFTKGWPTAMPTEAEAQLIADVRLHVAAAVGIQVGFTNAKDVLERYAQLMTEHGDASNDPEAAEPEQQFERICG